MADLAAPFSQLDILKQNGAFGFAATMPESVRHIIEGVNPLKGQLDLIRQAAAFEHPAMPKAMLDLFTQSGPYATYLDTIRQAVVLNATATDSVLDGRHPYRGYFDVMRAATEMQGLSPISEALSQAFKENNAYTQHLDIVRRAAVFSEINHSQEALRLATEGLPSWLRPANFSDTLLRSWKATAEIGLLGAAQPSLISDIIGVLHRDRPDTFTFDVAVKLAEGLDLDESLHGEWAITLLRKYSEALIEKLASTKDWVARQGLINVLMLVGMVVGLYYTREAAVDGHLSRLDADEQTELARAAASPEPTAAQKEMALRSKAIEDAIQDQKTSHRAERNIRSVIRTAPLRIEPDGKASVIRIVYPDDRVRVQEIRNGWALVEVFEYKSETTVIGWINRRVLCVPGGAE